MEYIQYLIDELQNKGYLAETVAQEVENTVVSNVDEATIKSIIADYVSGIKT
jgi:DNA-directed RNA polymerase specialized sigma54-like protein